MTANLCSNRGHAWKFFAAIALVAVCKMLEFQMSALVLKQLSAFELKAWLGVTLFASYFTDILFGAEPSALKIICIIATAIGLVFIASLSNDGKVNYKQIIILLILYLVSKFAYVLVIKGFTPYVSSTMQLLPAMIILSLLLLPKVSVGELIKKNRSGVIKVVLARIPNTIGMLFENAVISISLANYSFIQLMVFVTLFAIGLIKR
ncbi:hypothetical protein [uncultured Ruminococcus sp.]|uniref:hypothetical protein n=1 Tax=uncultured Ruminococcus sp. TaxID=165186 RepID=UPI0025D03CB7|nr:hypothetical protein [uncultured Ruminococcus sp.]